MAQRRESMRAVIIKNIGKPRALKYSRRWQPQPASGEALVKIHATSLNPRDLRLRDGRDIIRKPMPHILGGDLAGEIAQLGKGVDGWQIGERVAACFEELGCEVDGGYAEFCCLPADKLARMPDSLDYTDAVGAGAAFSDAHKALVCAGKLSARDILVIRGGACSLGAAATQIAHVAGARVIAISPLRHAAKLREIGADIVLEDAGSDLVRQVKVATDGIGVSIVLECGSQPDMAQSLDMLAAGGRLVIAGALDKPQVKLDAELVVAGNLSVRGASGSIASDEFAGLLQGLAEGSYQALIDGTLPLSQARQAHQRAQKSDSPGKFVLVPDSVLEAAKEPENRVPIT